MIKARRLLAEFLVVQASAIVNGPVAQGIEHQIPNLGVAGSNPAGITTY